MGSFVSCAASGFMLLTQLHKNSISLSESLCNAEAHFTTSRVMCKIYEEVNVE